SRAGFALRRALRAALLALFRRAAELPTRTDVVSDLFQNVRRLFGANEHEADVEELRPGVDGADLPSVGQNLAHLIPQVSAILCARPRSVLADGTNIKRHARAHTAVAVTSVGQIAEDVVALVVVNRHDEHHPVHD